MFVIWNENLKRFWENRFNKANDAGWTTDLNRAKTFTTKSSALGTKTSKGSYYISYSGRFKDAEIKEVIVEIKLK